MKHDSRHHAHEAETPDVDPHLLEHFTHAVHEEWQALLSLLRFHWHLVLLFLLGLATVAYVAQPFPPKKVTLAVGQPGSSLELLGKKYAEHFARQGVALELVQTAGAFENLEMLRSRKVDVAFSLGGMVNAESASLVSLGSVEYQPLWMFYLDAKNEARTQSEFLKDKTFSVNLPGSGTRSLSEKVLALHGIPVNGNPRMVSMSSSESVDALLSGRIDGMFLVAGMESKAIARLQERPDVRVLNFDFAETYTKKLNFLEMVSLPRGALDLVRDIPSENKRMVATTTTILTTEKLHPAVQHLFLSVAKKMDAERTSFFTRPGGFPSHVAHDVALSKVAARYYENGPPVLAAYAPLWLASFLDQVWFILFAMFAIGYPLLRIVPKYRLVYSSLCISDRFKALRVLDKRLSSAKTAGDWQNCLKEFERVEASVHRLWVPSGARENFYHLRNALEIIRNKTKLVRESLERVPS